MCHRRLQAMCFALLLLVMISASMSLPVDYQPGYDSYQPRDFNKDKRWPDPPGSSNSRPRHGRRGYSDSAYLYGADRQQKRKVPDSYNEPITV